MSKCFWYFKMENFWKSNIQIVQVCSIYTKHLSDGAKFRGLRPLKRVHNLGNVSKVIWNLRANRLPLKCWTLLKINHSGVKTCNKVKTIDAFFMNFSSSIDKIEQRVLQLLFLEILQQNKVTSKSILCFESRLLIENKRQALKWMACKMLIQTIIEI